MIRLHKLADPITSQTKVCTTCTNQGGCRDFSPGNVIVVGEKAKISDLEFAKRWVAEELARLRDPSLPAKGEDRVVERGLLVCTRQSRGV